jgi:hypothetical protein
MGPGIIRQDLDIIRHLGYISMIRGTDASGIYEANTRLGKKSRWAADEMRKLAGDWSYLLWDIGRDHKCDLLNDVTRDLVMCHVRWSTRGADVDENAHPFLVDNLVGFHNGTMQDEKYNLDKSKTDSEALFRDIAERGLVDVLPHVDPKSAYAIQMYDKASKTVYFARNDQRPLYFAVNSDRSVLYWASESLFLYCALGRLGVKFEKVFSLRPDTIVAVKPENIRKGSDKIFTIIYNKANVEKLVEKINAKAEEKKVENVVVKASNVTAMSRPAVKSKAVQIYNVTDKGDNKLDNMFVKCSCGNHRLNAFDSYHIKRKNLSSDSQYVPLNYDRTTNTFECEFTTDNQIAVGAVQ